MKRLHRQTLSRLASALGRRKVASDASAPIKLNYADPRFYSLPCSQSPSPLYQRQTQDDHMPFIVLAFAAVTAIVASTGDNTGLKVRPHAEPELYGQNDRRFDDVYHLAEQAPPLGSGSYGTVSAAVHKETGEVVAVKRIPRSPDVTLKEISAEVEVLKVAGEHRNITQFYELFIDDDYYYLTMEMAKGGELFDLLLARGTPTEAQTATLMKALVSAMAYVHMHGIIHGDIKPENVFLTGTSTGDVDWEGVLLGDFGSAVEVASGGRTTLSAKETRVTVAYSPPETLRRALDGEDLVVSTGGDVWALGVLLYMLLTGEHPFAPDMSISDEDLADNVMQDSDDSIGYVPFFLEHPEGRGSMDPYDGDGEDWGGVRVSPLSMHLVSKMLHRDPLKRPSAQEVLQHPWFRQAHAGREGAEPARVDTGGDSRGEGSSIENAEGRTSSGASPTATDALQVFWSGRRRLKGCLLAVMAGLVDGISEEHDGGKDDDDDAGDVEEGRNPDSGGEPPAGSRAGAAVEAVAGNSFKTIDSKKGEGKRRRRRSIHDLERLPSQTSALKEIELAVPGLGSADSHPPEAFIGSRAVACRMIDRGGKGYITAADLAHVMRLMGEDDVTEETVSEMMKAVDGDPSTESRRVTYEQMARLVPPLCPARKFRAGEELYKEGDLDPTFYLLRKGVVEFSVSTPVGKVPLQTQGPGASFGEVELLRADGSTAPRLATCRCLGRTGQGNGECEALVMRGHTFAHLTDVFLGVRARLGAQAEDRLTQLAGSVLKNGFAGYEQKVEEGDVVWAKSGGSSRAVSKSAPKPSVRSAAHRPSAVEAASSSTAAAAAASSSSLLASPAAAAADVPRVEGSGKRVANGEKVRSLETKTTQDKSPFALLVLEGSVTAVLESGGQGTRPGGGTTPREQVLGPGQFCFCGESSDFGPGAPGAPVLVFCRPSQRARLLRVKGQQGAPVGSVPYKRGKTERPNDRLHDPFVHASAAPTTDVLRMFAGINGQL